MGIILSSMRYKGFTWVNNPSKCRYSVEKTFAKHKYPELFGVELEDMDREAVVISGDGEFFGTGAYDLWRLLNNTFNEHGPGEFYHPVYTDISNALMTKLNSTLEPRENYVAYTFEFMSHDDVTKWFNLTKNATTGDTATSVATNSGGVINVGDTVICNGYAYYDSYGSQPQTLLMTEKTMVVTYTNYKGSHPIHVGSMGWMRLSDIRLGKTSATSSVAAVGYTSYVIKAGDTLSGIGVRYGVSWKSIAELNNIKDPNLIYAGDTIKIPNA